MASVSDSRSSPLSRVLFLSETGEPMRFFLRPGAIKAQLQPVICAGGGVVCKMQEPNAILLMAPEEMNEVPVSTALQYVSSQYILDCVEKNEQLEVDDYRFRNDRVQTRSARPKREGTGRMGYTAEEDAAILRFVRGRKQEVCGNSLWKQMAREAITSHSWQSMKDRYRKHLAKKPLEGDTEENQKAGGIEGSPIRLLTVPLQQKDPTQSSRQMDPLTPSPEKAQLQPSSEKKNTNCSPERTHPQPSADPTSPQPLPKRARLQCSPNSPKKMQPHPSPGRTHSQLPLDQTHAQPATEKKIPPALPEQTYPVLSLDRIHPQLSSGAGQPHSLAVEGSSVGKDVAGPNVTSTGTNGQLVVTGQVLEEQEQRITPKKRTLGVLEMAMKEFEDLDESEDDTPDIDLSSTAGADCSGLDEEIVAASSAEVIQENDDDDDDDDANMDDAEPQPEKSPDIQLAPPDEDGGPEVSGPAPKTPASLTSAPVTSKVHRFLFDRESQEEEPPQPACDPPFTQAQLEEARQQLRYLMKESGQGLDNVTKALLKNSGDVEAALQYLRHGPQGYLWDPRDDGLLRSGGPSLHILEQKYGKVAVARRIAFLEIQ
ncbi:telomeric repeat-binding factor 2-interacting protein 1 [Anguilla anguilla]|uniref:telomeric repeat-binding factor 2-interacting protein 1 n=1 Tax=Anguilla anguilla TaxID=7936 RepID=UPI0015ABDD11|nr:telomeric repeat-binding factor 2-interacting protein 1 [Anguilla anguilla]